MRTRDIAESIRKIGSRRAPPLHESMQGWWMHPGKGVHHLVGDHANEVATSPEKYGVTKAEVEKITGGDPFNQYDPDFQNARGQLIHAATKNGWVRIRSHGNHGSIQLHGNAASKLRTIIPKLGSIHPNLPAVTLHVTDFSTGWGKTYPRAEEVEHDIRAGNVPDSAGKAAVGQEAGAALGKNLAKHGVPGDIPEPQQRQILRQRLGQRAGVPARDIEERIRKAKARR
jgi:hypothetical protein